MPPKTFRSFKCFLGICVLALVLTTINACEKDKPTPTPQPSKATVLKGRVINTASEVKTMDGVQISAISGGNAAGSANINPKTGEYSITLSQPGTYDLRLKTPGGVVTFSYAVKVESGETVTAPDIELPVGAFPSTQPQPQPDVVTTPTEPPVGVDQEAAVLEGTVTPADAEVIVLDNGKVVARAKASGGKFSVPDVSPGLYEVEFSAPGYASERLQSVAVSPQGAITPLNGFLLYQSPLDGVDYDKGIITATGLGKANPNMPAPQAGLMACRAARAIAYRNLLDTLLKLEIEKGKSVRNTDTSGNVVSQLQGFVRGARVVREEKRDDGSCEVTLQVPLRGAAGVTKFLQKAIKK